MTTFHEDIQRWSEEDPQFAYQLALAGAESSLGEQTADIRERLGLTQAEVGRLMGVRQPSVARFEGADRTPTVETLWKVASALRCEFVIGPQFAVRVQAARQVAVTTDTIRLPGEQVSIASATSDLPKVPVYVNISNVVLNSEPARYVIMNSLLSVPRPVTDDADRGVTANSTLSEYQPAA